MSRRSEIEESQRQEASHEAAARAVYGHSAEQYVDAVGSELSTAFEAPLDRAVLSGFLEMVVSETPGPVLDVGCGPGRVAAFVAERGLGVSGIDIAPAMVAAASAAHPQLTFEVGSLTQLGVDPMSLGAAIYWYSIIATPAPELPEVWAELDRSLRSDGLALVAYQSGDNAEVVREDAYGSSTTLTLYHHNADDIAVSLQEAGFEIRADVRRAPALAHETTPQTLQIIARS